MTLERVDSGLVSDWFFEDHDHEVEHVVKVKGVVFLPLLVLVWETFDQVFEKEHRMV